MATSYEREPEWQEAPANDASNFRSVTPAMNNIRRNASPAKGFSDDGMPEEKKGGPSSSGLIRLALRKPMGIVFEPMYDPNSPSVQRGVRICDLPRTGAAALSRKLEVGDELLSINDKTMSRLTFDEIMDFIIEADPEQVNLLFRRPRKEVLNARNGNKPPSGGPGVKWVDDDEPKPEKKKKERKDKKSSRRSRGKEDDETLQTEDDISYRRSRRARRRHNPYESESFLDILIDTICANPDSVCRDRRKMGDDETYYSEDDETYASRDDSTYVTYESEPPARNSRKSRKKNSRRDDYSSQGADEDTQEEKQRSKPTRGREREPEVRRPSPMREPKRDMTPIKEKAYEDDGTLETVDSKERERAMQMEAPEPEPVPVPPLGLVPNPEPTRGNLPPTQIDEDEQTNPAAPIRAVEFDEDADVGADVSVMESLGGPSLLIEKQRQAQILASKPEVTPPVPRDIADNFGLDYPLDFGFSREQTIQNDPLRFYSYVVKALLQEHEPEKVRLLDKLLAKYKGREDHLVQKLSVRYNTEEPADEQAAAPESEEQGFGEPANFDEAVIKAKGSAHSMENIETARERMNSFSPTNEWPEKETKEQEPLDEPPQMKEEQPEEGGSHDYSDEDIDGTSPAVIAQVSELLNYVYGKTSVPGQIDRVSTIMRAYEGREAVLLELLETKALIKANREKENAGNLPAFLRNSMNAQREVDEDAIAGGNMPAVTPMAMEGRPAINDDMSSMSGVAPPAPPDMQKGVLNALSSHSETQKPKPTRAPESSAYTGPSAASPPADTKQQVKTRSPTASAAPPMDSKKKKKGFLGGLFKKGKKDSKTRASSNGRNLRTPVKHTEASI
ncbi:unnamed protein product [Cylindrotheca closterium]|uniref:PDZ domain-containing protein n=1 Tax=Cylindrotheca closterium TaxID=2856 RepID=A0AAD2G330_9STRA|nr:unnamed protein product [Cylindrotheca closterium]